MIVLMCDCVCNDLYQIQVSGGVGIRSIVVKSNSHESWNLPCTMHCFLEESADHSWVPYLLAFCSKEGLQWSWVGSMETWGISEIPN